MPSVAELERIATAAEREAEAAGLAIEAETAAAETGLQKAIRLAAKAARAREAADLARRTWTRRSAFLALRLAILAALLWLAWRIGYETGLVAAIGRACT